MIDCCPLAVCAPPPLAFRTAPPLHPLPTRAAPPHPPRAPPAPPRLARHPTQPPSPSAPLRRVLSGLRVCSRAVRRLCGGSRPIVARSQNVRRRRSRFAPLRPSALCSPAPHRHTLRPRRLRPRALPTALLRPFVPVCTLAARAEWSACVLACRAAAVVALDRLLPARREKCVAAARVSHRSAPPRLDLPTRAAPPHPPPPHTPLAPPAPPRLARHPTQPPSPSAPLRRVLSGVCVCSRAVRRLWWLSTDCCPLAGGAPPPLTSRTAPPLRPLPTRAASTHPPHPPSAPPAPCPPPCSTPVPFCPPCGAC